jgi:hypothetical protein
MLRPLRTQRAAPAPGRSFTSTPPAPATTASTPSPARRRRSALPATIRATSSARRTRLAAGWPGRWSKFTARRRGASVASRARPCRSVSPSPAKHSVVDGQATAEIPLLGSTLAAVQAAAPPVGLVDVTTLPAASPATHSVVDGQETAASCCELSTVAAVQTPAPPVGLLEATTVPA